MSRLDPPLARPGRGPDTCRWCGQGLSALARVRGEVCDAMDCRRRETDARVKSQRISHLEADRAAAARAWRLPALAPAPVLWLRHHAHDFSKPAPADIAELRAHLMALEDDDPAPREPGDDAPRDAPSPPIADKLCALCRGRCCRQGLQGKAFLESRDLRDWLAQRPGARWVDAVEHYLDHVAAEHLQASCLFHSAHGCTLPRERRSDVCNQFACSTLEQLRDLAGPQADPLAVVGVADAHTTRGAALLSAAGHRWLPGLRERE
jgi:hypothetical protein